MGLCKHLYFTSGLSQLPGEKGQIKDNRYLYRVLFLNSVFSQKSFLQMDHWGRLAKVKRLFAVHRFLNRRYRQTVLSDSTMIQRLREIDPDSVRKVAYYFLSRAQEIGYVSDHAIIDGTGVGKGLYSCLCFLTRGHEVFFSDVEPMDKRGKELESSQRLLLRCYRQRGNRPIGYLLMDALYFTERFYQLRAQGYVRELVIKYTPPHPSVSSSFRRVLQCFEEMVRRFESSKGQSDRWYFHRMGFRCESGVDASRGLSYILYSAKNNSWDNRYQIARVVEYRQGKLFQQYYVISTDKSLSGEQMRRLAYQRWQIENNGFKSLNRHVHSKRCWTHQPQAYLNLLLIQLLAFSFLVLFRWKNGFQVSRHYGSSRITLSFISVILAMESFKGVVWQES